MANPKWLSACFLAGAFGQAAAKVEIDAMKHDIQQITMNNFDGVISKFRDSAVSALWFFNEDNKADADFLPEYNKVAGDLKGMLKVTAISCTDFPVFCKKQGVTETPAVMIYPINPQPTYQYKDKMEAKTLTSKLGKLIPDFSVRVTKDNADTFLTTDPTKPKALLFTNKKGVPTIWKALSSETVFKRTVKFGIVHEDETDIVQRFKVKKFPSVLLQRGGQVGKTEAYKGDMSFSGLKDWVNLHSESGMGDKVAGARGGQEEEIEEAKPWLVQEIPELTAKSQKDICFKGEGLCVIYLADGAISAAETEMLSGLSKKFTSQLSDRGAKMKWMWINLKIEAAYKELFAPAMLPSAVVFNPHKRLRFAKLDHGEDNDVKGDEQSISNLMDKVLGGDARFAMVKGQKLPGWAARDGKTEL